jgi:hypothetical protein
MKLSALSILMADLGTGAYGIDLKYPYLAITIQK